MSCHTHCLNGDSIVEEEIERLLNRYKIKTIVETGTYMGNSTLWFSKKFANVHTIELNPQFFMDAVKRFIPVTNIKCYCGPSETVLGLLLPSLAEAKTDEIIMIYLDAHSWGVAPPLIGELKEIAKTFPDRVVIVIDDFEVPNRKVGHNDLGYAMIKDALEQVYPKGHFHYYIDKSKHVTGEPVGKIYITPKALAPTDLTSKEGYNYYSNL